MQQPPSSSSSIPLPEEMHRINQISALMNTTPTVKKLMEELLLHGTPTGLVGFLDHQLARMRELADLKHRESKGEIPKWEHFVGNFPFNIFSECCFFHHGNYLWIFSPKSMNEVILQRVELKPNLKRKAVHLFDNEDEEGGLSDFDDESGSLPLQTDLEICGTKEIITILGEVPLATVLFRKMPRYFVYQEKLFLGFPTNDGHFVFKTLDLTTFRMEDFLCPEPTPLQGFSNANEGVLLGDIFYLVTSATTLWTLNLQTRAWRQSHLTGPGPTTLSGSSNLWNGRLYTFSTIYSTVYELNLAELCWTIIHTISSPQLSIRDCVLMRPYRNSFILLRMSDNSELWILDMETKCWEKRRTLGRRPGNYSTNPSYLILGEAIYCLSGQSTDKHTVSLFGQNPYPANALPVASSDPPSPPTAPAPSAPSAAPGPRAAPATRPAIPHFVPKEGRSTEIMRLVLKSPEAVSRAKEMALIKRRKLFEPKNSITRDCFPDVTLIVNGDRFKAHRCILASSPWFKTLFNDHKDSRELTISDTTPQLFKFVIDSFYGVVDLNPLSETISELYCLAEKFGMSRLQKQIIKDFNSVVGDDIKAILEAFKIAAALDTTKPFNREYQEKTVSRIKVILPKAIQGPEFASFCEKNFVLMPILTSLLCVVPNE